jgi:DnaJ-class molecular chaperone
VYQAQGGEDRHSQNGAADRTRKVVQSWYREMAKKFHPDRTLDNGAVMKAINAGYERLQELLGG